MVYIHCLCELASLSKTCDMKNNLRDVNYDTKIFLIISISVKCRFKRAIFYLKDKELDLAPLGILGIVWMIIFSEKARWPSFFSLKSPDVLVNDRWPSKRQMAPKK